MGPLQPPRAAWTRLAHRAAAGRAFLLSFPHTRHSMPELADTERAIVRLDNTPENPEQHLWNGHRGNSVFMYYSPANEHHSEGKFCTTNTLARAVHAHGV
jgi:hypothetical protein